MLKSTETQHNTGTDKVRRAQQAQGTDSEVNCSAASVGMPGGGVGAPIYGGQVLGSWERASATFSHSSS